MRKLFFIFIVLIYSVSFLTADVVNSIVGVVGNYPITREDFLSRKTFLSAQARSFNVKITDDIVYKDLIEERVAYNKLEEFKYTIEERDIDKKVDALAGQYKMSQAEFKNQLKKEGISYNEYRAYIKKQIAFENLYSVVASESEVSDREADEFYNKTDKKQYFEGDTIVKVSWIFFKATSFVEKGEKQELASRVRNEAVKGKNFDALAKEYSDDDATKNNGGDLGYQLISDLDTKQLSPQISQALSMVRKGSKVGAISTVGETVGRGFWIVKITDIQVDKASIRTRVKNYLSDQKMQESFQKWLKEESERLTVVIYN